MLSLRAVVVAKVLLLALASCSPASPPAEQQVRAEVPASAVPGAPSTSKPDPTVRQESGTAVVASPAAPTTTEADESAVRARFEEYRAALLARDGKAARELVDRRTIEAYQEHLELARTVDRAALGKLDWMGKFMVLRLRHEFDGKALAELTGEKLFVYGIERGWISDASVGAVKVAQVTIDGPRARLSIVEQPKTPLFSFAREPDGWRFCLWTTFPLVEKALQKMYEESHAEDEVDWLIAIIEALSPKRFDRALLDGPPK